MIKIAKITINETPLPYNSIMVVNIGAKKGKNCPSYHWLYTPKNKPGFYRVGFYSNVENPLLLSPSKEKVKLYVEKAFVGGETPSDKKIKKIVEKIIKELQDWQFIKEVEVVDVNWIETAYTWSLPNNSKWREKALKVFQEENIWQIGRYGRWQFQGVLESIKEGLNFL